MDRRVKLHEEICQYFGKIKKWVWDTFDFTKQDIPDAIALEARKHVYFQPPETLLLQYPCIVYRMSDLKPIHADNKPYFFQYIYELTIIDRDPVSIIRDEIINMPSCRYIRTYESDGLHHFVFRVTR